ncbi:MAG TPA: dimethylsulfoxide reductase subunit B [Clostridia bacterium]|nr:dimethylsulfoxide reductase subunit B [Clostridia bacterium]
MGEQKGFCIEQNRCMGCKACQVACKDKNDLEVGQRFRKVTEVAGGGYHEEGPALRWEVYAFWISLSCNHCADPLCVKNCPTGAMYKRAEDGIVLVDEKKCIGCRYCMWSCPYEAPQYNQVKGKIGKCDLCFDLLQKGEDPVCVTTCPMRAIHVSNMEDLQKQYGGMRWGRGLPDPTITEPSLLIVPHRNAIK